jgi:hypothetical protein
MKDPKAPKSSRFRCEPLSDDELYTFVSDSLRHNHVRVYIDRIDRRVAKRRTDWRGVRLFEKLSVRLTNCNSLILFLKYYHRGTKSDLQKAPLKREADVYRSLLKDLQFGTAQFYGSREPNKDQAELILLEFVRGRRLKKYKEEKIWLLVSKWLAQMHHHFFHRQNELYMVTSLHRHDSDFYWNWAYRAAELTSRISAKASKIMDRILADYDRVATPLSNTLLTLLHGELFCTNILLNNKKQKIRICPFDWETAAIGCGALDLSYLLRQRLGIRRSRIIEAYLEGWRDMGDFPLSLTQLRQNIYRARVHELMYLIWSGINHQEASADRIVRNAERAEQHMESLG